jgi:S1-C subfamily serine protease
MRHHLWIVTVAALGMLALATPCAAAEPAGPPGFLGVMVGPGDNGKDVVIRDVAPGSPAATAGVKAGDRVVKVGKDEARDVDAFMKAVATHKPGDKVALTVERDGKEQTLTATLGERPATAAAPRPEAPAPLVPPVSQGGPAPAFVGVQVQPLTPELRDQLKVQAEAGAVITEVAPGSPAEKGGLKRDDVVTAANDKPVRGPEDLRAAVQHNGTDKDMALAVAREGKKVTVKVHPRAGSWGAFFTPGDRQFPPMDVGPTFDQGRRIRELEKRVAELEKKLHDLDHKSPQK